MEEFPWMAALYYTKQDGSGGEFKCGGTMISNRYVLTAARCLNVPGFDLTAVRFGEWKFSANKDCIRDTELIEEVCTEPVVDVKIEEKIAHVYYNSTSGSNDIALLRLESKIQFSEYIRPICLPPSGLKSPTPGSLMTATGWGLSETGNFPI
ncbi:hypothetical protein ILUMI_10091 [Ignelater luminosus]|uniref:Peptidase S1 domain-containing protein n=1 Tax=Ignelater luminosus TaxID=2038154 RepID=A0A8K0CYJ3_IGNLU|nr:hypothetical protein ILUMI_10091 [Ignelater luminosus]